MSNILVNAYRTCQFIGALRALDHKAKDHWSGWGLKGVDCVTCPYRYECYTCVDKAELDENVQLYLTNPEEWQRIESERFYNQR